VRRPGEFLECELEVSAGVEHMRIRQAVAEV